VSEELLPRTEFAELADGYRAELLLHCYRILGSVQDAEDLVQETLMAAWRSLDRFEGRASLLRIEGLAKIRLEGPPSVTRH
jgi:DNA-directed RNA polymerase specialized sigma24 family protein